MPIRVAGEANAVAACRRLVLAKTGRPLWVPPPSNVSLTHSASLVSPREHAGTAREVTTLHRHGRRQPDAVTPAGGELDGNGVAIAFSSGPGWHADEVQGSVLAAQEACAHGCDTSTGTCAPDRCVAEACNQPCPSVCLDEVSRRRYQPEGACVGAGQRVYDPVIMNTEEYLLISWHYGPSTGV